MECPLSLTAIDVCETVPVREGGVAVIYFLGKGRGGPGRDVPRLNVIRVEGVYKANAHACDLPSLPRASKCERFAVVQQAFGS